MACHVYSMSIGSLIGGVYAVGMSVHEMEKIAMEVD
jgi:predicted acylesterase/phospholipase RssA